jgi:hypothetical protein
VPKKPGFLIDPKTRTDVAPITSSVPEGYGRKGPSVALLLFLAWLATR